jgi:CheY-like chemotaxis protein
MPISRQYARMMGGDLTAKSEVGKGSTFRFTFTAEVGDSENFETKAGVQPKRVIGLKPGCPAPKVLVVDDNDANRDLLRRLLESIGFQVCNASGGREAVRLHEEWHPAMVLMDRRMPDMDGLEATRMIKASPGGRDTFVVMVTASVLEGKEQDCFDAGADGFVSKPFKDDEIMAVIGRLLDVDYVYEETATVMDSSAESFRQLVVQLPADLRAELIEVTESGYVSQLQQLIETCIMPGHPALGQKFRQLTKSYDYEAILQLLRPGGDHE